jgi:hypothetical protein
LNNMGKWGKQQHPAFLIFNIKQGTPRNVTKTIKKT